MAPTVQPVQGWLTPEMRGAGYAEPSLEVHFKLDICSSGNEKRGKTHWAFTAPDPIAAFSTDSGTEEIAEKFRKQGRKIAMFMYRVPAVYEARKDQEAEWVRVRKALDMVIRNKSIRSLIVDTASEVWELLRMAKFGKLTQVLPVHYGPVNSEMRDLVKECYDRRNLNVIWVHKNKKEYKTNKVTNIDGWTGGWERAGFSDMGYLADVNIDHYLAREQSPPFGIRVSESRYNMETLMGMELEGSLCNFPTLAQIAHPDSSESDWV